AVPLGAAAAWLLSTGAFNQFLFWNFQYGIEFGARIPFSEFPSQLWQALPGIINGYFLAWFLAGIGIFFALRAQRLKPFMFFIACFSLASAAAVSLGFQFRSHYFVMILPALSLFAGIAITGLGDWLKTRGSSALAPLPALAVLVAVGYGVYSERDYFFRKDVDTLSRDVYYPNPFAEVATIAEFIKSRTAPNDKIAVLGSEPEILVGAQRFSATPYLFTYFFMEPHEHSVEMQKEMIASVDKAPPKIIVLVNLPISWGIRPRSERLVLNWIATDIKPRYDIVGVVDLLSPAQTIYKWNDEARSYNRLAAASILLLQRRTL
ncbi:MAG TPA: hypothetical protein VL633_04295, partial [Bacteroidota bacterium]|nr:hypothetical protein [Bacteroidota bacterium]